MRDNKFENWYREKLWSLADNESISGGQLDHFLGRGVQLISPASDFGLESLGQIIPKILIGASEEYIESLKIPYQATSYIAANTAPNGDSYVYKIPGKEGGGVLLLFGGQRKLGDNAFASISRILLGHKATMVSVKNLMINKHHIWNWQFFGNNFKKSDPELYEDLVKLDQIRKKSTLYCVVVARYANSMKTVNILEEYRKNKIAILNPANNIKVIFITSQSGYDYVSNKIPESNLLNYIVTGEEFDIYEAMVTLRKKYDVNILLNDGGRYMSNGVRDAGLLGEERITLEPYPGIRVVPEELASSSILGSKGIGLDWNELQGTILVHSTKIGQESANIYLYPLDDQRVMRTYR
jgi:hypothetical protein